MGSVHANSVSPKAWGDKATDSDIFTYHGQTTVCVLALFASIGYVDKDDFYYLTKIDVLSIVMENFMTTHIHQRRRTVLDLHLQRRNSWSSRRLKGRAA